MRTWSIFAFSIALLSSGCANLQLKQSTVRQASTLTALQYQMVLDNLAMFCSDHDAIPWHVNLKSGAVQVTDSGTLGFLGQTDFSHNFASSPTVSGTRSIVQQWGSVPVTDDETLRLLRAAYQAAIGYRPPFLPEELVDDLAHSLRDQTATNADISLDTQLFNTALNGYQVDPDRADSSLEGAINNYKRASLAQVSTNDKNFMKNLADPALKRLGTTALARDVSRQVEDVGDDFQKIPVGWVRCGKKRDVPRDACYVGRSGDSYAWVCTDHRAELAEFTLIVLNFAALIKDSQVITSPAGVQFSPGIGRP